MLIHAMLADRHYKHSNANAVLFRGIRPIKPDSILPRPGSQSQSLFSAEMFFIQKGLIASGLGRVRAVPG